MMSPHAEQKILDVLATDRRWMRASELVDATGVSYASVAKIVHRLSQVGIIERRKETVSAEAWPKKPAWEYRLADPAMTGPSRGEPVFSVSLTMEEWDDVLGCIHSAEQEFATDGESSAEYDELIDRIDEQLPKGD